MGSKALLENNNVSIFSVPPVVLLLLKEVIKRVLLRLHRPLLCFCCGSISKRKIVAEIASILLNNPFSLRFAALVICARIVKLAIQTAVEVCITERARLCSACLFANLKFSFAGKTYFHGFNPQILTYISLRIYLSGFIIFFR